MILHELGHYYYDHLKDDNQKPEDEFCCDFFAAYEKTESVHNDDEKTYYFGMITSFIAIELIEQCFGITGDSNTHPSNLKRIQEIINITDLPDDSFVFEYCAYGLSRLYPYLPEADKDGFHYESAKEYYKDSLRNAKKKQA
jgi:hypothetical protein